MMKNVNIKRKKKIAILIPSMSGGGAERVASELSRFLRDDKHDVFIFTENEKACYDFEGKIVLLKPRKIYNEIIDLLYLAEEIREKKLRYEIDVSVSFFECYNLANIISKKKDKVIIRVCTILSARTDLKGVYYNKSLLRFLYNKADTVVVLSPYGKKDMLQNYGIRNNKLVIIPNAVIPRCYEKEIPWKLGDNVILNVNRLHPIKQQGILVDAMKSIIRSVPDAKLLLVGNDTGEYANKIKKHVKKNNLGDNVFFTGQVKNVEYYMHNSRIFVVTSFTEGFPNVVVEAMNQGLPIISTDFSGPARNILGVSSRLGKGKYGIVVPQINESKKDDEYIKKVAILSDSIIEVLSNQKIHRKYSSASEVRAQYFSKERIENMWRRLI